jgi:hypothetical protein
MTPEEKATLLCSITPKAKTQARRYLVNVVFFHKEFVAASLHAEYFPGVGTGQWFESKTALALDSTFGGALGIGAQGIVQQAFKRLIKNFAHGDTFIDSIGYRCFYY